MKLTTRDKNKIIIVKGGNFALGKTSNLKLDEIYRTCLPVGRDLLCDTPLNLTLKTWDILKILLTKWYDLFPSLNAATLDSPFVEI